MAVYIDIGAGQVGGRLQSPLSALHSNGEARLVAGCKAPSPLVAHRKVWGEVVFNRANVDWNRYISNAPN